MKVNSASSGIQANAQQAKKANKEDIQAKLREKFGKDFGDKKAEKKKEADTVVSIDTKGNKEISEEGFGDIKNNDPSSDVTQEKLRGILRVGGFDFNAKERAALGQILNK